MRFSSRRVRRERPCWPVMKSPMRPIRRQKPNINNTVVLRSGTWFSRWYTFWPCFSGLLHLHNKDGKGVVSGMLHPYSLAKSRSPEIAGYSVIDIVGAERGFQKSGSSNSAFEYCQSSTFYCDVLARNPRPPWHTLKKIDATGESTRVPPVGP